MRARRTPRRSDLFSLLRAFQPCFSPARAFCSLCKRPYCVTHVSGMNCHPSLRKGNKNRYFFKARSRVHFPGRTRFAPRSHDVAQNRCGSNSKQPNRNDGAKHGQTGNRPARHVNRTVGFGRVHHRVMPMGHISLLRRFPAKHAPGLDPGACPGLDPGWRSVRVKKTRQIYNLEPRLASIETKKAPQIASRRYVSASDGKVQIR
jgi:hypothetical protein